MALLDSTIVFVAFPSLRRSFPAVAAADLSWVLNGYTAVYAALLVPAGRVADRAGRRRVFLQGLLVFTLGSLACGVARTPLLLIGGRILQAIGGAQLTPTSLALVLSAFPRPKWPVAISLWAAAGALAAAIGPSVYRAGLVDFLSVLEAQGELYSNEAQLVQSQSVTTDLIALYRALGGGWSVGGIVNKPTP